MEYNSFIRDVDVELPAPEKSTAEYIISTQITNAPDRSNRRQALIDEFCETSPLKNLICLNQKYHFTSNKLAEVKKKQNIRQDHFDRQWNELKNKEDKLRVEFLKFNVFIHENTQKRDRMNKNTREQIHLRYHREKIIAELNINFENLNFVKKTMQDKIKECSIYQNFLNDVLNMFPEFENITDILTRHAVLEEVKIVVSNEVQEKFHLIERAKEALVKLVEDKSFIIMGLNTHMANLQTRYETAHIKALESEQLLTKIKNNAVQMSTDKIDVIASIWNTYCHMVKSKNNVIEIQKDDVEHQLIYIKTTLAELQKINRIIEKRAQKMDEIFLKN